LHVEFWWESQEGRDHWEDLDVRGEIGWGGVNWIDVIQDGDQWRALVNTAMSLRVPQNVGKFLRS
jgi:hypothetical protein